MKNRVFTSFNLDYAGQAILLAKSLKKYEPDAQVIALLNDEIISKNHEHNLNELKKYFDRIVFAKDVGVENFENWKSRFNIIEFSTAIKPFFFDYLFKEDSNSSVMYLDPDICVFNSFYSSLLANTTESILLTPHQLRPNKSPRDIIDNELGSSKYGIFNLGFLLLKPTANSKKFTAWWKDMCEFDCSADKVGSGVFTDQKWCDFITCFFEDHIALRDEGLNVASWNLSTRHLKFDENGNLFSNNDLLKFFHFTKVEGVGMAMIKRYALSSEPIELMRWYMSQLKYVKTHLLPSPWAYNKD
jgi:hypothetical protein